MTDNAPTRASDAACGKLYRNLAATYGWTPEQANEMPGSVFNAMALEYEPKPEPKPTRSDDPVAELGRELATHASEMTKRIDVFRRDRNSHPSLAETKPNISMFCHMESAEFRDEVTRILREQIRRIAREQGIPTLGGHQ